MQFTSQEQAAITAFIADTRISSGNPYAAISYADVLKVVRNFRLRQSDWTQLADAGLSAEKLAEWVQYRKDLRDLTDQAGFPNEVTWPVMPS